MRKNRIRLQGERWHERIRHATFTLDEVFTSTNGNIRLSLTANNGGRYIHWCNQEEKKKVLNNDFSFIKFGSYNPKTGSWEECGESCTN